MAAYGLALSGGGIRGAAHVGALLALEEANLLPDWIAGTSAGSIVAGLYASGLSPHELREVVVWLEKHGKWYLDPDVFGISLFLPQIFMRRKVRLSGLFQGKRLTNYLCDLSNGSRIETVSCGILIPAVDLITGDTIVYTNLFRKGLPGFVPREGENMVWKAEGSLCDIMMASSSVPAVFRPKRMGEYLLVDGGVTNNLPVDLLIAAGGSPVIAIDVGTEYETPPDTCIMEVISSSFSIMSRELKECRSSGELFLLKPELPHDAGLLSFHRMSACVEAGYACTRRQIGEIRKVLR